MSSMDSQIRQTLQNALAKGQFQLNEADSKQILAAYGLPVVQETRAADLEEAKQAANRLGYPVVLKALGSELAHKTELGLVRLDIQDKQALEQAYTEIKAAAEDKLEGMLLQPQIKGKREFVAGLFRDPQFGAVVMFGLGGIYTEALRDVSFAIAPLSRKDALQMLEQIKSKTLLQDFRGEAKVDQEQLISVLLGLSRIGMDQPQIAEIDINPLLADPEGNLLAVDALMVLQQGQDHLPARPAIDPDDLGRLFYPKSVAFVGASEQMGKWGHLLITNVLSGGYQGDIYPVNPKGGWIAGHKVYTSLAEIPGKVDLAVVTIPALRAIELIPELQAKGIKSVVLIASGFAETGEKGRELEQELVHKARQAGILVLGPNTMGICNPHIDFHCTGTVVHPQPGSISMVSQSGNMGVQLLCFAQKQGIGIRGFCGSGNEAMLGIEDYLDSFAVDSLTQTVMLYVESVKDGRRFVQSAKKLAQKKPVILLKGGESEAGDKAASSHTGAMSSNSEIFEALCRQTGIIKVNWPMDLLDLAAAFSSLPLPKGNRIAIVTLGGGWGVITADLCAQNGLQLPELSQEIIDFVDQLLPDYWSRSNPIDLVGENDLELPGKVLEQLLKWDGCDAVINLGIMGRKHFLGRYIQAIRQADPEYDPELLKKAEELFSQFEEDYVQSIARLMTRYNKPVFGVKLESEEQGDKTVFKAQGQPFQPVFYQSPEKAVRACAQMYKYYDFLKGS
ncbi:MAG: acetate--CoA ligase family protein [Desulfohalobiaceae bacterium]